MSDVLRPPDRRSPRGRQAGKVHEMARQLASRTSMQYDTVRDLLAHGYVYTEYKGGEARWTRMS